MDFLRLGGFWVLVPCTARKKSSYTWSSCWVHAPSNIKRSIRIWFVACIFFVVGIFCVQFFSWEFLLRFFKMFWGSVVPGWCLLDKSPPPPKIEIPLFEIPKSFFLKKVTKCCHGMQISQISVRNCRHSPPFCFGSAEGK